MWLSQYTTKLSCFTRNSCRKFFSEYNILCFRGRQSNIMLNCHETTPLTKVSKYLNRDFLESTSPTISAFVFTCNTSLSPPKQKTCLGNAFKIFENPLYSCLMFFIGIREKLTNYTNHISNIWPCTNHGVHQTAKC